MILYVNGCSLTYGLELKEENNYRLNNCWSGLLVKKLDYDLCNDAIGGSCNERIVRTTIEWILNYKGNLTDVLVIIGWSRLERTEFFENNNFNQINISTSDKTIGGLLPSIKFKASLYYKYFSSKTQDILKFSYQLYLLQEFLKSKAIKYYFFNSAPIKLENNIFLNNINNKYYLGFNSSYNFYEECELKKLPFGKLKHPLEEGHQYWANILEQELKKVDLI